MVSPNRTIMIVLAYLWILALVPLIAEKEDREVQWHAKHGLVLFVTEIIIWILFSILTHIPALGCGIALLGPIIWLVFLVIRILCIVKGINGQRFIIPGISPYADRF